MNVLRETPLNFVIAAVNLAPCAVGEIAQATDIVYNF